VTHCATATAIANATATASTASNALQQSLTPVPLSLHCYHYYCQQLQIFSEPDDDAFVSVFQRLGGGSDGQDQTMTRGTVLALLQRYGLTVQDSWSKERRRAHKRRVKAATQLLDAVPMQAFMD
jgi:hypothetical protein